jgi:hypothetical protein
VLLGGDVDGAEVEKVGVGIVAVDFENFGDESSAGSSLDVDYNVERIGDVRLNLTVRQLDAALQNTTGKASQALLGGTRVNCA